MRKRRRCAAMLLGLTRTEGGGCCKDANVAVAGALIVVLAGAVLTACHGFDPGLLHSVAR